jgi:ribosome-associated protein
MDDPLVVPGGPRIPLAELTWRFTPSGGPGGQHANRSSTRAEVSFDIVDSPSLTDAQRARLQRKLGDVVTADADDARSQSRNREVALARLGERLAQALREPKRRRPTKPSRSARQRRLEQKRRRSETKAARRPPRPDD